MGGPVNRRVGGRLCGKCCADDAFALAVQSRQQGWPCAIVQCVKHRVVPVQGPRSVLRDAEAEPQVMGENFGIGSFTHAQKQHCRRKNDRGIIVPVTDTQTCLADFEKLLSDVARNDRDNMMTQTYLTSDTGKVYTMLAHASGRFGRD